jgi:hypothetical protein
LRFPFFLSSSLQKPLQHTSQTVSSNIPSISSKSTANNNFQQTLPRYNPPPNPNHHSNINNIPTRRIPQRGRYSTGTASSLIPTPGSFIHQQTPLASPALSTASTAVSAVQDSQLQKSHIPFPSRLPPQEMLKFQVRKTETEATTNGTTTNAQIQVRSNVIIINQQFMNHKSDKRSFHG